MVPEFKRGDFGSGISSSGDTGSAGGSVLSFEYYLVAAGADAVQVSLILPVAGPSAGGSLLNVSGQGFKFLGGTFCRFGSEERTVPATVVSAQLAFCESPLISTPLANVLGDGGLREYVQVSLNGQDYTTSSASFLAFDKGQVHVSALVPSGGPMAGGTMIEVLGNGFVDHNIHCTIGHGSAQVMVRASLVNSSALRCLAPSRPGAAAEAVEVTLNGDVSAHTLTSDAVRFDFLDPAEVSISSIAPLGGPAEGGTLVTLRGTGFVDRGGVFCRFGADPASSTPATLLSSTELRCMSPASPHRGVLEAVIGGSVWLALTLNGDLATYVAMTSNTSILGSGGESGDGASPVGALR